MPLNKASYINPARFHSLLIRRRCFSHILSRCTKYTLWRQAEVHRDLMYFEQHTFQSKKVPRGVEFGVNLRVTDTAFSQETRVASPLKPSIISHFLNTTTCFFVPKLHQPNQSDADLARWPKTLKRRLSASAKDAKWYLVETRGPGQNVWM